ncbi:MAG: histidinol-phosphate transaminase [Sporomusaceae bacterium]|nr:histidinol-phosphate transaminase [Sporomusaceae bacterium]
MKLDIRESLQSLTAYHVEESDWKIKLDANEKNGPMPLGVAEKVQQALSKVVLQRYPGSDEPLRGQIAAAYGLTAEQVALGCGSSEILLALCIAFGGKGRKLVFPSPSFSMYEIYGRIADSQSVPVALADDFSLPVADYIDAAKDAQLALLCNPNNPTGNGMALADVEKIVAALTCPVVVDEAYMEFYGETALPLLNKYPNLIIARTLSKAYGLASARTGYMIASQELIEVVNKVLLPYHVNAFSLAAAEAVFSERSLFEAAIAATVKERQILTEKLSSIGVTVFPSQTNFLLVRLPRAEALAAYLAEKSIAVRSFHGAPALENCIRITVGTSKENEALLKEIVQFLEK